MEEEKKKRKILKKLKNKYRLVILNDASFEEKFSYRLSPLNIFTLFLSITLLIVIIVTVIIVFTPLRESIPGYTDVTLRKDLTYMVLKADSLERELKQNQKYLDNINTILRGEDPSNKELDSLNAIAEEDSELVLDKSNDKSTEDSLLRAYVEREDSYSLELDKERRLSAVDRLFFFNPLEGTVTQGFNSEEEHFGVDIVAPKNEAVKAVLRGTVIFAEWTVETGYVIHIQHENNLSSIYKHNSVLLKKEGEEVKAGEAIAIVGNTGELTTGPHLHFELWQGGVALDPSNYINFN
jgi:murein DD-endopeptidase MepM/ murein hydrolase activator NlpD